MPSAPDKVTCVLADDSEVMRDVSRMVLNSVGWVEICAEAADGVAALDLLERHRPDLAMLDMRMPGMTGLEVATRVRAQGIPMSIIIFSAFDDAGISETEDPDTEYVSKLDGVSGLVEALERVRLRHAQETA